MIFGLPTIFPKITPIPGRRRKHKGWYRVLVSGPRGRDLVARGWGEGQKVPISRIPPFLSKAPTFFSCVKSKKSCVFREPFRAFRVPDLRFSGSGKKNPSFCHFSGFSGFSGFRGFRGVGRDQVARGTAKVTVGNPKSGLYYIFPRTNILIQTEEFDF